MRLKKLGITTIENDPDLKELLEDDEIKHELMEEEEELPVPKPVKRSRPKKDKNVVEDKAVTSTFSPKSKSDSKSKANQQSKATTSASGNWTTLFQPW